MRNQLHELVQFNQLGNQAAHHSCSRELLHSIYKQVTKDSKESLQSTVALVGEFFFYDKITFQLFFFSQTDFLPRHLTKSLSQVKN